VINLTREQRHTERLVLLKIQDAIAARMQEDLAKEWAAFSRNVEAHPKGPGLESVVKHHQNALRNLLEKWGRIAARVGSGRVRDALRKRKSFSPGMERKATEAEYEDMIQDWIKRNALEKSKTITGSDRAKIKRWFADALEGGLPGENVVGRGIRERMDDVSVSRAKTIARTETHSAVQETSAETMKLEAEAVGLEGETQKVWTAGMDMRVRESHAEADGQAVDLDGAFIVGGVRLRFPGDPLGPAEEVINCRCILTYDVKDEDWDAAEAAVRARGGR
jgi:uncharacterized protein with gpF-like domain